MRWELHYIRVYPTIFSCVDPRYQLSRFFTGISRRKYGELISLIGNQRVGIFPPKSGILFVLSLALIWYRNFQDRTIPLGGDTWPCFWRKEGIIRIIRIKKYSRSGLFFRSNISETVGDIRVLFSLWPRAIVALPNGANDVSVVHIVSEIWSRQHQNFGMLTCTSERNQYPFEWIRTANNNNNKKNKEISRSGLLLPVEYLRNGKRYSSFVFTVTNGKSHATKRCNPRLCCCYRFWDIVVANIKNFKIFDFDVKFARATWYMPSNEFARHNNKNEEISRSGLLLPVEYLRNGKRYSSSVSTFDYVQESRYQTV